MSLCQRWLKIPSLGKVFGPPGAPFPVSPVLATRITHATVYAVDAIVFN